MANKVSWFSRRPRRLKAIQIPRFLAGKDVSKLFMGMFCACELNRPLFSAVFEEMNPAVICGFEEAFGTILALRLTIALVCLVSSCNTLVQGL